MRGILQIVLANPFYIFVILLSVLSLTGVYAAVRAIGSVAAERAAVKKFLHALINGSQRL